MDESPIRNIETVDVDQSPITNIDTVDPLFIEARVSEAQDEVLLSTKGTISLDEATLEESVQTDEYKCAQCHVLLINFESLSEHMKLSHHVKCGECDETYINRDILNKHISNVHMESCNICNCKYINKELLDKHMWNLLKNIHL